MKIVIAIDSFKGCMTTNEVSQAVEKGIKQVYEDANIIKVPIADGGEGTVDILIEGLGGHFVYKEVNNPLMKPVLAKYGILNDQTAIIEMATCSGLPLLKESERNPLKTTTYGVGELIKDAINKGCRDFIIGIGGSATNDAGMGMLEALGYKFYDENHQLLKGIGESLNYVHHMDDSGKLKTLDECRFSVLCDVDNPFFGPKGASYVYAKQKGADKVMVEELDQGLKHFASFIEETLGKNISSFKGAGAAGGLGGGIHAFLNGELLPGIEIIFNKLDLEIKVKDADIFITGEGKMDFQSVMGKAPMGVSQLGKKHHIPVIGISGSLMDDAYKLHQEGMTSLFSIMNYPMSLEEAMDKEKAMNFVEKNTKELFRLIKSIK
ncbi:glycerate kinase [Mycoplasmatota bacterium]|nr:glycerate kinase [Mycoplasmatota bacterium]